MAHYFIGTSGWHYDHWRGKLYPPNLPKAKWLDFYAGYFSTVELNNSFYRLPSETALANWRESSSDDFTFAVKVSRFITHIRRLRNSEEAVEKLITRARVLEGKLGPLLYQLPPNMHRNDDVLEFFLSGLPRRLKHVFEFRHQSWLDQRVLEILEKYNAGFCVFDMPSFSCPLKLADLTANLKTVYVYFNNDAEAFAVRNAITLRNYLQKDIQG